MRAFLVGVVCGIGLSVGVCVWLTADELFEETTADRVLRMAARADQPRSTWARFYPSPAGGIV